MPLRWARRSAAAPGCGVGRSSAGLSRRRSCAACAAHALKAMLAALDAPVTLGEVPLSDAPPGGGACAGQLSGGLAARASWAALMLRRWRAGGRGGALLAGVAARSQRQWGTWRGVRSCVCHGDCGGWCSLPTRAAQRWLPATLRHRRRGAQRAARRATSAKAGAGGAVAAPLSSAAAGSWRRTLRACRAGGRDVGGRADGAAAGGRPATSARR